jgi:hypothetical protein
MKKFGIGGANLIWCILSVLLFVYLIIRAVKVPILHDEVATLNIYVLSGNFLPWNAWADANNHLLNSFLSWLSCQVFGIHPWSLRLPNVLSVLLYFSSVIGISASFNDKFLKAGFIMVLFFTHGFIEFFAFARGYGMSMSFLLFAVFLIFRWQRNKTPFYLASAMFSVILAAMANLTLLPSVLMIAVYVLVLWIINLNKNQSPANLLYMVCLGISAFIFRYLFLYSLMLKKADLLYYGGESGFINAIVKTHTKMLFFQQHHILIIAFILIFLLTLAFLILKGVKTPLKNAIQPDFALFPMLLFGSVAGIFIMHFFMHVNYPEDRTSIFLYPYLIGSVFFIADQYKVKLKRLILLLFLYVPLNFFFHINTAYSFHWHYERIPPAFAESVRDYSHIQPAGLATISGYKIYEYIWGYYTRYAVPEVNLMNPHNYPNNADDFILLRKEENDTMPGYFSDYEILQQDPYSNIRLLKRKTPSLRSLLFEAYAIDNPKETSAEYLNFFPDTLFDFCGKSILFEFDIEFEPGTEAQGCVLVASVRDSANNNLMYQRLETAWLNQQHKEKIQLALSVINIPANAAGLIVYIWNKHKKLLKINHAAVRVYEFGESSPTDQKNSGNIL